MIHKLYLENNTWYLVDKPNKPMSVEVVKRAKIVDQEINDGIIIFSMEFSEEDNILLIKETKKKTRAPKAPKTKKSKKAPKPKADSGPLKIKKMSVVDKNRKMQYIDLRDVARDESKIVLTQAKTFTGKKKGKVVYKEVYCHICHKADKIKETEYHARKDMLYRCNRCYGG